MQEVLGNKRMYLLTSTLFCRKFITLNIQARNSGSPLDDSHIYPWSFIICTHFFPTMVPKEKWQLSYQMPSKGIFADVDATDISIDVNA